jgi:hypothetical protein
MSWVFKSMKDLNKYEKELKEERREINLEIKEITEE